MRYICPKCDQAFAVKPPTGTCPRCDATLLPESEARDAGPHEDTDAAPPPPKRRL